MWVTLLLWVISTVTGRQAFIQVLIGPEVDGLLANLTVILIDLLGFLFLSAFKVNQLGIYS